MNISALIAITTMLVPGLLYLGKVAALNDSKRWLQLSVLALVVALVAWGAALFGVIDLVLAVAASIPLLHLLLFRACRGLFVGLKGREPKDTSLVFTSGLAADRIFALVYVLLAVGMAFALVGPLIWATSAAA